MKRGGVLFEVMLSIALFVGAAAFALGATRSTLRNLDQSWRQQQAIDLARSKMAELEAGLIGIGDLRGQPIRQVGSIDSYDGELNDRPTLQTAWIAELSTSRTAHGPLTLIQLTVREDIDSDEAVSFTLRQLIRLREEDAQEYEEDDLLEGLTDARRGERR